MTAQTLMIVYAVAFLIGALWFYRHTSVYGMRTKASIRRDNAEFATKQATERDETAKWNRKHEQHSLRVVRRAAPSTRYVIQYWGFHMCQFMGGNARMDWHDSIGTHSEFQTLEEAIAYTTTWNAERAELERLSKIPDEVVS